MSHLDLRWLAADLDRARHLAIRLGFTTEREKKRCLSGAGGAHDSAEPAAFQASSHAVKYRITCSVT